MRIEASDEIGRFVGVLPVLVIVAAIGYFVTRPAPTPPLPNAAVFGCYVTPNGPAILLNGSGMHVRQTAYPVIPFHLEWSKTGIVLAADAPIRADKTSEGYRFGMNKRGAGWFMHFYREENERSYGVFDEKLLAGFQMLATDGAYVNYDPSDASRCA